VLETIGFHRRSRDEFVDRFSAATTPPPPVIAHPLPVAEETVYWLPEHRALVPGDTLVSTPDGELSLCPPSWLDYLAGRPELGAVRDALRPLLELDVELVLTSHGEPVRAGGHAALARALDAA
jgi:glyoxylase-like metal-dependent hydrolase (beta-lactamase superfamily II)